MRYIDKLIIHCSATPEGRDVTVDDIRLWHKKRGFSDVGYHYIIYLDGTIVNGRPVEEIGAHCVGYNTSSIGICYIGGTDAGGSPKDTRTPEQKHAIKKLISDFKKSYPEGTIHGHREFANKACPSYDVQKELSLWKKLKLF